MNEINIKNISKKIDKKDILKKISMSIKSGEIVGLLGPNGAGKTTCFDAISGLTRVDTGQIIFDKQDVTRYPMYLRAKLGISYLPQEASIFRELSVADNIIAVLEVSELDTKFIREKLMRLLNEFSITHLYNTLATNLSGGERRRVEIARALATNPTFIMLDEPLAGIDPISIIDIKNLITHLKNKNLGILITDHNVRDVLEIVDKAYIIYNGQILIEGTPKEIMNSYTARELYFGQSFRF